MNGSKKAENSQISQALYLVFGGELSDLEGHHFKDAQALDICGIFSDYEQALLNWRAKAQQTVDNAHMRYYIVNLEDCLKGTA